MPATQLFNDFFVQADVALFKVLRKSCLDEGLLNTKIDHLWKQEWVCAKPQMARCETLAHLLSNGATLHTKCLKNPLQEGFGGPVTQVEAPQRARESKKE